MKAEELASHLRIGNLLYYKNTKYIAKVELIHNKHFDCRDEHGCFTPNGDYEPIPLSEDVLLKCGAREYNRSDYSIKYEIDTKTNHINILYKKNRILVFFGMCYLTDIKHLHQLQNLYYALTGEELEVSI